MARIDSAHPDAELLRCFGLGLLHEDELERISEHLATCESCQSAVEDVPPDAIVKVLQSGDTAVPTAAVSTVTGPFAPGSVPEIPPELTGHPRYRVLELLGSGGMGAVYKTEHRVMDRIVAVKVINSRWMREPAIIERFNREVRAAARLTHPNIVTAYDAESAGDIHFLVMEYVEGTRLDQVVEKQGPLPISLACDYACQVARGLDHAHKRGMVHRDIKPHNLILTSGGQVKILDFGLARFVSEISQAEARPEAVTVTAVDEPDSLTSAGAVLGTAEYMAPEQIRDAHAADIRADIYSLGCTLYHLLTGHPPFPRGRTLEKLIAQVEEAPPPLAKQRPDVPVALARAVEKMLAKDPAARFQTPAEVLAALTPLTATPHRRRWPAVAAGVFAILLAATVFRVVTDKGELVIETDDPDVQVTVLDNGKQIAILDTKANKTVRLWSGEYGLQLSPENKDSAISTDQVSVRRGDKVIVKVSLKPAEVKKPEPKKQPDDRGSPREPASDRSFRGLDLNGDGVLSGDEIPAALKAELGKWNTNKDGLINREEYRNYYLARASFESPPKSPTEVVLVEGQSLTGHRKQVNALAVSPDSRRFVSVADDRTIRLWDIETGREVRRFDGSAANMACAAFSRDGKRLLTGGADGFWRDGQWHGTDFCIYLWDVETGEQMRQLKGHTDTIRGVQFLPDGKRAISAAQDSTLRLWNLETGGEIRVFEGHQGAVSSVGVTADGKLAVSGGYDKTVRVWDIESGKPVHRLEEHTLAVRALSVSPDGKRAVSAGEDRRIVLWNLETGKFLRTFSLAGGWPTKGMSTIVPGPAGIRVSAISGHQTLIFSVAFSPDGTRVVSGGGFPINGKLPVLHKADNSVRVWDVATGQEIGRFAGHTNFLMSVVFAENGRAVLSAGADKLIRVNWLVPQETVAIVVPASKGSLNLEGDALAPPVLVRREGKIVAVLAVKEHPSEALSPGVYDLEFAAGAVEWRLSATNIQIKNGGTLVAKVARAPAVAAVAPAVLREIKHFDGHTAVVTGISVSPDGRTVTTTSNDNSLRLWDIQTGGERRLVGLDDDMVSVAYFSDGSRLATGAGYTNKDGKFIATDFSVRIWDTATGKEQRRFLGHTSGVVALAVSQDRKRILSGSNDATSRVWEAETGRALHVLQGHEAAISSVAISPNGRLGLTGSWDATVRLWDLETGREVRRFDGHTEFVWSVVFSPDGQRALSSSSDRTVRIWDVVTGKEVGRLVHPTGVKGATFSPDGQRVLAVCGTKMLPDGSGVSAGYDQVAHLWDLDTNREIGRFEGHTAEPMLVAFHPDGKSAFSAGHDKSVRHFELPDTKRLPITEVRSFPGPMQQVNKVAFTPDGKRVLSACCDGVVRVCERDTGKEIFALKQPEQVLALAVSPDGKYALAGGGGAFKDGVWQYTDFAMRLWNLETGTEVRRLVGHEHFVMSIAFSPDGKQVVSGSYDTTLRLWDVETGRQIRLFTGHEQLIRAVALSPDGHFVLSSAWDGTICLWEVATGRELRRFVGHVGRADRVLFTNDGRHALSCGIDRTIRMWNIETGREVRRFAGHMAGILDLALSPDGRLLLSGSGSDELKSIAGFDNSVRIWDVATGQEYARFEGHINAVVCLAFSRDGKQALSGSTDATVRLLQLPELPPVAKLPPASLPPREMVEVLRFSGHRENVSGVALGGKAGQVVTASFDGTLRLWDMNSGKEVRRLNDGEERFFCLAVTPDGTKTVTGSGMVWKDDRWQQTDHVVRVVDIASGKTLHRMMGHSARILCIAASPDSQTAISGGDDGTLRLWDLTTGRQKLSWRAHGTMPFAPISVAFLPDGKRAVSGGWDDTVRVWDVATGRELQRFEEHGTAVIRIALSPDGRRLLSANADRSVRLWDVETGKLIRVYPKLPTVPLAITFLPDGKRFLTGSGDRWRSDVGGGRWTELAGQDSTVRLHDVASGEELARFDAGTEAVRGLAISPDGQFAVVAYAEGSVRLLYLPPAAPRNASPGAGKFAFAAKSLEAFVVVRRKGEVVAAIHPKWEPATDLPPGDYELEIAGRADGLRLTPERVSLKSGDARPVAIEWLPAPEPSPTLKEIRRFEGHTTYITQVVFAPDGKRFASCSWDRLVRIWDAESGKEVKKLEHPEEVWTVAWSPDGKSIASAGGGLWTNGQFTLNDRSIRIWNAVDGTEIRHFTGHTEGRVSYLKFSPDSSRLLSSGDDRTMRLWDVAAGKELKVFRDHRGFALGLAFAPDGKRALSASHDGIVRLWDLETGDLLRRLEGHTRGVQDVVFLKEGTQAASSGLDRTIRIWDLRTGEQVRAIGPLPTAPGWLTASARGQLVAGFGFKADQGPASFDNSVRVWDAESGRELAHLSGHTQPVSMVAVSRDGSRAVSAGHDKVLRMFELPK